MAPRCERQVSLPAITQFAVSALKFVGLHKAPLGVSDEQLKSIAKEVHDNAKKVCTSPELAAKAAFVMGYAEEAYSIDTAVPLHTRYLKLQADYKLFQRLVRMGAQDTGVWGKKMPALVRDVDYITDQFFARHTTTNDPIPAGQPEVLQGVLAKVKAVKESGGNPLILLDLDDTLFSPAERHIQILREYLDSFVAQYPGRLSAKDIAALRAYQPEDHAYSMTDDVQTRLNVTDPTFIGRHWGFFVQRFFTSTYLAHDTAYAGAPEFVGQLAAAGAKIVYLSGRQKTGTTPGTEGGMYQGTLDALARYHFPTPDNKNTFLFMKDRFEDPDVAFKETVFKRVDEIGTIVAAFDNDPFGDMAYHKRWPAITVTRVSRCHAPNPKVMKLPDGKEISVRLQDIKRLPPEVAWIQDWRSDPAPVAQQSKSR